MEDSKESNIISPSGDSKTIGPNKYNVEKLSYSTNWK